MGWANDLCSISAKTGQGVDHLLEMIQLQSKLWSCVPMHANPAKDLFLKRVWKKDEVRLQPSIAQEGTINVGDYFIAGNIW